MRLRRYTSLLFLCIVCYETNVVQTERQKNELEKTNRVLRRYFSAAAESAQKVTLGNDVIKKETMLKYLKLHRSRKEKDKAILGQLGAVCLGDKDCSSGPGMACRDNACQCRSNHVQHNATFCLPGVVLGFTCVHHSQCRLRVPDSSCVQGFCRCGAGRVPYRRANCLNKSFVGEWCRIDSQCQAGTEGSRCHWIVRNVLGKCQCRVGKPDHRGTCKPLGFALGTSCGKSYDCAQHVPGSVCVDARSAFEIDSKFSKNSKFKKGSRPLLKEDFTGALGRVCRCPRGYLAIKNGTRCVSLQKENNMTSVAKLRNIKHLNEIGVSPVSLGKPCHSSSQCKASDPYTFCDNGVCDCVAKTGQCSRRNTGCLKETFQCASDGRCLSANFVCDGKRDCHDGSDEAECQPGGCSSLAFTCADGSCEERGRVCDGVGDCADYSDEAQCQPALGQDCPSSAFRCGSGECVPGYAFCNAFESCRDRSDEKPNTCIGGLLRGPNCPFRCKNGRCRSAAIICSGQDGCGDNSDEENCSVCNCPKP